MQLPEQQQLSFTEAWVPFVYTYIYIKTRSWELQKTYRGIRTVQDETCLSSRIVRSILSTLGTKEILTMALVHF